MKLTNREILLIKILILAAVIALSYYFIISPQVAKLNDLKLRLQDADAEMLKVKAEIKSMDKMESELEKLSADSEAMTEAFYPDLIQKKLIIFLDELTARHNIRSDSISFSKVQALAASGGTQWMKLSVSMPYTAKYSDLISFIEDLEQQGRMIILTGIQLSKMEEGMISGTVNMDFYAVAKPKINENDREYLDWPYDNPHGKSNPFDGL